MKAPEPLSISVDGEMLECVSSFKYLGIWLDPKLSWDEHSDRVYKKMSGRANLIGRHHHSFGKRQLKVYCDSLVMSVLGYLLPVWGSVCTSRLEAFDAIMLRLVKKVIMKKSTIPTPRSIVDEFEKLNWLLAAERRDEYMLNYFFKHFVLSSPLNFLMSEMFAFRSTSDSDRVLRKERNVVIPMLKTVFGQSSFSYRVAKRWNALPAVVQNSETFPSFSEMLRHHIVNSRPDDYLLRFL
jgi:hypothetical protein